jgi:hypothetical protein
MNNRAEYRHPATVQDIATASLVAIVTCALTTDAFASHPPAPVGADLSMRVAAIATAINASEAAPAQDPAQRRTIVWNNGR